MPTYQYICSKCGHEFEVFQSMNDKPLSLCPKEKCAATSWGRGKVKRQLGLGAGIIFKGSGFYITDYRSEGYKQAAKSENQAASPKTEAPKAADSGSSSAAPKPEPSRGGKSAK